MDWSDGPYVTKTKFDAKPMLLRTLQQLRKHAYSIALIVLFSYLLLPACTSVFTSAQGTPDLAEKLTIIGWEGYMPQSIMDDFAAEYGVEIEYVSYAEAEEAVEAMRNGETYDLVVLDNLLVAAAAAEGLLAELDYRNLPNFNNIGAAFRDLAFDPKNTYSVPFQWGTTGLLYRSDLVEQPLDQWADLWNPAYSGRVALWPYSIDAIGIALKSLGYSSNSHDPQELAEAGERLMALKDDVILLDPYLSTGVPHLLNGDVVAMVGWAYDLHEAEGHPIEYILPEEGTLIWMDNLVIPANSPDQYTAETFLNFLMRPDIGARIANEMYLAIPNEAAHEYIEPEILNNPLIFPSAASLKGAEFYEPATPEVQAIYDEIWQRFTVDLP